MFEEKWSELIKSDEEIAKNSGEVEKTLRFYWELIVNEENLLDAFAPTSMKKRKRKRNGNEISAMVNCLGESPSQIIDFPFDDEVITQQAAI